MLVFAWERQLGLFLTGLTGAGMTALGMIQVLCQRERQPYCALVGTASAVVGLASFTVAAGTGTLKRVCERHWKWMLLRGIFGTFNFGLASAAVSVGTPLSDAAVLQCISAVIPPFVGTAAHLEKMVLVHWIALLCSILAVAITMIPGFMASTEENSSMVGYVIALFSGVFSGSMLLTVRMLQDVDVLLICSVVSLSHAINFWALHWAGFIDRAALINLVEDTQFATMMLVMLVVLILCCVLASCKGGKANHAGGSTTIYMAVNMAFGFLGQAIVSGECPRISSFVAAALMMPVFLTSWARRSSCCSEPLKRPNEAEAVQDVTSSKPVSGVPNSTGDATTAACPNSLNSQCEMSSETTEQGSTVSAIDTPSIWVPSTLSEQSTSHPDDLVDLASFIVSEISGWSWDTTSTSTRQRRPAASQLASV